MACDLCGKEAAPFKIKVEGTVMNACAGCKSYGELVVLPKQRQTFAKRPQARGEEKFLMVSEGFSQKIKHARESRGMKQEDLAQKLKIKESQLHGFENGHKPDISTARLLEKELRIRLVEEYIEEHAPERTRAAGPMTIADMIKKK